MEAFQISTRSSGLDLVRSQFKMRLGSYVADATALFRSGMLVQLNSEQKVVICDGTVPFGFSQYNKTSVQYASIFGEYIQLNGVLATELLHPLLLEPSVGGGVRVGLSLTGAPYTETTDFTVNYNNGSIKRTPGSLILDGAYVYVNYQYQLSAVELEQEGLNYWNQINDVSLRNSKVTIINDWSFIFTSQYDSTQNYAVNDILVAGNEADDLSGLVTKGAKGTAFVGRVFQPPTASDPYLGIRYVGGMVN
jgi:hypothetical protein